MHWWCKIILHYCYILAGMMLPLEIKQSGGKLLPHSVLRGGGVFLGEASRKKHREMKSGTWNVRSFYRAGSVKAEARGICEI